MKKWQGGNASPLLPKQEVLIGSQTGIEWTDVTWNPVTGCTRVSAGCDNCYAAALAERLLAKTYLAQPPIIDNAKNREDPFAPRIWPDRLRDPKQWRKPRHVFVNSMSDLFHVDVPPDFVRRVFATMLEADRHTYQILTKRPARAATFVRRNADLFDGHGLPTHIWIGTSVEMQEVAYRIRHLCSIPARIRFLSCEPLLGPLCLDLAGIDWVIVGGESGPVRRPIHPDWVRSIRDQCHEARTPFFFKQWGGLTPKQNGRELDGQLWNQMPKPDSSTHRCQST